MSVADLLRALMLPSANDAAVTLARGAAGSVRRFVRLMNRKAAALGLRDTHYANPVGLDEPGNYSSARDLASLTRRVLRNDFLAETVDMPRARLLSGAHERVISNRNDLVGRVPFVDGVKTGHTADAGYVLVGAAARRGGVRLVSVVLGTPSESARDSDTLSLLRYGLGLFRRVDALSPGRAVAEAKVAFYGGRRAAIRPAHAVVVGARRDEHVRTEVDAPSELHGPLPRGARVGAATVYLEGKRVRTVALVTAEPVPGAGFGRKLVHWTLQPLVLVALAALALIGVERRRRRLAAADAARRRRRREARAD
jgi:D-alanyl-D-alanine carboxypeptidase (penicillin-binding protein 5/6)